MVSKGTKTAKKSHSRPRVYGKTQPQAAQITRRAKMCRNTRERVNFVSELLGSGLWITGLTERLLAEAWGFSRSRVRAISAEAHRLNTADLSPQTRQERREQRVRELETWKATAVARGDLREAREHQRQANDLEGLVVTRHEHNIDAELHRFLDVAEQVFGKEKCRELLAALSTREE